MVFLQSLLIECNKFCISCEHYLSGKVHDFNLDTRLKYMNIGQLILAYFHIFRKKQSSLLQNENDTIKKLKVSLFFGKIQKQIIRSHTHNI